MKRSNYIFPAIAIALLSTSAQAQKQQKDTTMNRTVVVEQEYTPLIMDAAKINVLPEVEEPTVNKETVTYATTPAPATQIPASTMQPYMGKETRQAGKQGYARVGYGNYGNLDVAGNYLFHFTDRDRLNLGAGMEGMDSKLDFPASDATWNAYYYRTKIGADFTHQFDKVDLNVGGNFGLSNFNFQPYYSPANKQKFTSGDVRIGVKSTDDSQVVQYDIEAGLLLYQRQHDFLGNDLQEKILRTKAMFAAPIRDNGLIAIEAEMNNLMYSGNDLNNFTLVELNPYYNWENDSWKLHLGAHADIGFGDESHVHFAPNVTAQYLFSDSYVLYAKATGGDVLNDFRHLEAISPYGSLTAQPEHTHERINAGAGFKASPVPGLWFDLFAGYQDYEHDLREALVVTGLPELSTIGTTGISFIQTNTNNVYVGGQVNYGWKDIFAIQASATYRSWDADDKAALRTCPTLDFHLNMDIRPIPALLLNTGYRHITREKVDMYDQMAAVSNLYLGAEYNFYKGISMYARFNNLLNKEYSYFLSYPSEKLNFVGGLSFRF